MSVVSHSAARLNLDYFDGRSAAAQTAAIWIEAGQLWLQAPTLAPRSYPVDAVRWPERQRHGQRQALLPDGGVLSCAQSAAWDDWASASLLPESSTVRWMQSWRLVAAAFALLIVLTGAGWRWGVPAVAHAVMALLPPAADARVGAQALAALDQQLLKPSTLGPAEQQAIAKNFAEAAAMADPQLGPTPHYRLHFRAASKALGPNAFALPGGDIVLTDDLARLLADTPDALVGVLAHELGHVRHRHGMRTVVQAGLVGVAAGLVIGDFSAPLAAAPAVLAEAAYSRDFEREADEEARRLMLAAGIKPRVMVTFFERVAKERSSQMPIAIASHPANEERIRFFSE